MRKLVRSRSGMTLVEVTVAFALLCIIITVTATVIVSSMNIFGATAVRSQAQMLGESYYGYIEKRLTYCNHAELQTDTRSYARALKIEGGELMQRDTADGEFYSVFGDAADDTLSVSIQTSASGSTLSLRVTVSKTGEDAVYYDSTTSFILMNLRRGGGAVEGTLTQCTDPCIYFD